MVLKIAVKVGIILLVLSCGVLYVLWKKKRVVAPIKHAINEENTAAWDALIRKHYKTLNDKNNTVFCDVFDYLVERNSLACMRVLFSHADALTWQRLYIKQFPTSDGPLWETANFGSLEMLRLLLAQGMKAEEEWTC